MIGEIPNHIGSKLGKSETVEAETIEVTPAEKSEPTISEEGEVEPASQEQKSNDPVTIEPSPRKPRIKKRPKRVKREVNNVPSSENQEVVAEVQSPTLTPAEDAGPAISKEKELEKPELVKSESQKPIEVKREEVPPPTERKIDLDTKNSEFLDDLREQEKISKKERRQYLDDLSNKTKDFLTQIKAEREEWLQNFKSNAN